MQIVFNPFTGTFDYTGVKAAGTIYSVDDVAALKALPVSTVFDVSAAGYYTAGDGGGGMFYGVTGAPAGTYVDNGGTVILPTGGDGSSAWLRYEEPTISVKAFGAKGDGVTDATARIQAAVNAWKSIEIPVGNTFSVAGRITVPADVYISGPGTIFVNQSPYYVNCFRPGSGCTFDGIVFRGADNQAEISPTLPGGSNFYGKAIAGHLVNDVTVKNCEFYNFRDWTTNVGGGIVNFASSHNIKVLDNYFEDSNFGQFDINAGYRVGDMIVDGNVSYSNSDVFLGISTLYDDISPTIKFQNSANHIVTNNIAIKSRWQVPLLPVSSASFTATIAPTNATATTALMTVTGPVTGTIIPLQQFLNANFPIRTQIVSPGVLANTWELLSPTGGAIPTIASPTPLSVASGATFTGTIANKVLTVVSGLTGRLASSQWLFVTPPGAALPEGTKISTSTAEFTGSISGSTLTIATSSTMEGTLLADGSETIFGLGIPNGTVVASQILPLAANEAIGGVGRYTLTIPGGGSLSLGARAIFVDNRWNILSSDPNLSRTSVVMTTQQTNLGRHGILAHYDQGYSYLTATNNFFGNVSRHGVYLRGSTDDAFDNVGPDNVSNNYFVYCGNGPSDVGSYASGIRAECSLPTTIIGNYFYKTGFYPNGSPGIQDAQDIETSRGASDLNVAFNTCLGAKDGAILLDMSVANSSLTNIKVVGNTIQNSKYGIAYGASAVSTCLTDDIQILNNNIVLTGADYLSTVQRNAPRAAGIWADISQVAFKYSLRISGNTVVGTGLAASFTGTISGQTLTATGITGAIAPGQQVTWQTASFTGTISNGSGAAGNILDVTAVSGTILADGTEVVAGTSISTGTRILKQLTGTPGGIGTYQVSVVLNVAPPSMTSSVVGAVAVSPMATFVGSISNGAGAAGTTLYVTEMGSGTIVPGGSPAPTFVGIGVTVAPGTTINSQITPLIAGEALGGVGRYTVSGAAQLVASSRMSITNVWNLNNTYAATGVAMTSASNAYGIALPFGTDTFAGTALVDDNTFRGLQWGLASLRFVGNIANLLPHKKLGFEVVWDRNRFVSCDNAMFVGKSSSTGLALINPNNVFDGCTNTNVNMPTAGNTGITGNTVVRGRSLGQTVGATFTGEWMGGAPPVVQAYEVGDRVLNSAVASGRNIGWICTTAGTPGTWQTFGAIGLLSGSTTGYNPGTIANNASVSPTVTVTGAVLGDYVTAVSFSQNTSGLIVTGWVSAADTVTVRMQNNTGADITPGSGTLRVTVTKA